LPCQVSLSLDDEDDFGLLKGVRLAYLDVIREGCPYG